MMQAYRINRSVKLAFEPLMVFMRWWKEALRGRDAEVLRGAAKRFEDWQYETPEAMIKCLRRMAAELEES